jgi:hypothetical protein
MQADRHAIAIRFAGSTDADEMRRLALLDSAAPADGETLVAEVDGHIQAALPLGSHHVIADPFEPTAELASLLELRARQLRTA